MNNVILVWYSKFYMSLIEHGTKLYTTIHLQSTYEYTYLLVSLCRTETCILYITDNIVAVVENIIEDDCQK